MSESSGGAVIAVATMGGMYLFVDSIAIAVLGGALLGIFLVCATICAIGAGVMFVAENPIRQLWGWLVYFVLAPILIAAPFAFMYYVVMNEQTSVNSTDQPVWKNIASFLSFFWLIADVLAAGGLYMFLLEITEDREEKMLGKI